MATIDTLHPDAAATRGVAVDTASPAAAPMAVAPGEGSADLLAAFPRNAFIPAANEDYAPIEQVARDLDLLE